MASKMIDLTGKTFGWLTVKEFDHMERHGIHNRPYWRCTCRCGTEKVVSANSLRSGSTTSCGCFKKHMIHQRFYLGGADRRRLRHVLRMARTRCEDSKCEFYHNYGGRGISVCDEWKGNDGLNNFYEWAMAHGYKQGLTLDRIDNSKGYSPDNCRFVTMKGQSNNKRNNICFTFDGVTKTLTEWCEYYGVPFSRVRVRYNVMGWDIEDALFTPRYGEPISGKQYEGTKGVTTCQMK